MRTAVYVVTAIAVVAVALRIAFVRGPGSLSAHYGSAAETLAGAKPNAKRALVVYQPNGSGSTRRVAMEVGKAVQEAGYAVELNSPGPHLSNDLSGYSLVAFGSAVYAGQMSSTLADYIKSATGLPKGKVVLFSSGAVKDDGPELSALKTALGETKPALALKLHCATEALNTAKLEEVRELAAKHE